MTEQFPKEEALMELGRKAKDCLAMSGNCAQLNFAVLQEQFELEEDAVLKARPPFLASPCAAKLVARSPDA